MKKQLSGLMIAAAVLLVLGTTGCKDEYVPSGDRSIIAFVISGKSGAIDAQNDRITVVLPAGTDLTSLTPEVSISDKATVSPASAETVNLRTPTTYTVTAENGAYRQYVVTVTTEGSVLNAIAVTAYPKTVYDLGELFNPTGIVVTGIYSDGSAKAEYDYAFTGFDSTTEGEKTVTVTVDGKTATFKVLIKDPSVQLVSIAVTTPPANTVYEYGEALDLTGIIVTGTYSNGSTAILNSNEWSYSGFYSNTVGDQTITIRVGKWFDTFAVTVNPVQAELELSIKLRGDGKDIAIYGIPQGQEEMIILSWTGRPDTNGNLTLPTEIVISTSGYSSIQWFVDNTQISANNIITIKAANYTLERPYALTFIGTESASGYRYSKTIQFTVVK